MVWNNRTIYIGNLPRSVRERDLDDIFCKYGKILHIDIKSSRGFAFLEFDRRQDALEAARGRNGYVLGGRPMDVTVRSHSSGQHDFRHTNYRVLVENLPDTATWQELKSHASMAGTVCYAEIYGEKTGITGVVHYQTEQVMQYALMKLQGTEFKNSTLESNIIVTEYDGRYSGQQHSNQQVLAGDKMMPELDGDSGPRHSTQQVAEGDKILMPEIKGDTEKQHSRQQAVAGAKRPRSDVDGSSSSRSPEIPNKRPRV